MKRVVTGLEGCRKSSYIFKSIISKATPEHPVLFGVKNYKLMIEQMQNWSQQFDIPLEEFAICGFSNAYEPALNAYTHPEFPYVIPEGVRFVFTTQAVIQRNRHKDFLHDTTGEYVKYQEVVIDEFDFTSGIIPTLDYQINNHVLNTKKLEKEMLKWVSANYTFQDRQVLAYKILRKQGGFHLAYWITHTECDLTFLTSEKLSTLVLQGMGFEVVEFGDKELEKKFKDCHIHYFSNPNITNEFMYEMNLVAGWNRLPYDLIISDKIKIYFESNPECNLDIEVITHTSARGSNEYSKSRILTVITYIPKRAISIIQDALKQFGKEFTFKEIESMFYRDRLCQAVGRTLGYRGGAETSLVIHSNLLEGLKDLDSIPYTFVESNVLESLDDLETILSRTQYRKELKNEGDKKYKSTTPDDLSILDTHFVRKEGNQIKASDLKQYLEDNHVLLNNRRKVTGSKVAKYFNVKSAYRTVNGVKSKYIFDIDFRY